MGCKGVFVTRTCFRDAHVAAHFLNSIIYDEVIARLTSVTNITGAGKLAKMLLETILVLCLTGFAGKSSVDGLHIM